MEVIHDAAGGATVYITDLGIRVGAGSRVQVPTRRAMASVDLLSAIDQGLVQVSFTAQEARQPGVIRLKKQVERIAAKRRGRVLAAEVTRTVQSKQATPVASSTPAPPALPPGTPVRQAVFLPV